MATSCNCIGGNPCPCQRARMATVCDRTYPSVEDVKRAIFEGEEELRREIAELRKKLPSWDAELDRVVIGY